MKENTILKTNSATGYIGSALCAFGGLGTEVLVMMAETNLYGQSFGLWSDIRCIIHWMLTCLIWGYIGIPLVKKLPVISENNIRKKNLILVFIIAVISVIYTSLAWKGFKPAVELSNLGAIKFLAQYIYYAFETLLVMLIIAHGQKAFESWFGNIKLIPFGGIFLAFTWGLVHILTQGVATGIFSFIQALLYGSVYMLLNKNYKISYIAIVIMFML